ncbi:hypothetical protein MNEG_5185 [Monoraphidium neglectum]|uniref:GYF domain-containing protein n=1 Tax=Monoraphidium neglectum TaxID=145388 RepID=A0A0D2NBA5_9CHLO|nr:hypothetical protein MNEG_5185 [Monoraphidium neglectum]KIZ02771.1 hypothetical protein MNEG_5185 [Monoraphidium neglectum]|eukprot:XP_013901790.1 hypothetical protein MNEG_5185 [Monoraphidium neglectum]
MPCFHDERSEDWFYVDPDGAFQGPFSITQLRSWAQTMSSSPTTIKRDDYERFLKVHSFTAHMQRERRCMLLGTLLLMNKPPNGFPGGGEPFRPL